MFFRLKNITERVLQYSVVLTSVPPFTWAYAAYYHFTLAAVVLTVRFFPEVVSVYLGGGGANKEFVFGLSDIDPIILVKGDAARVQKAYSFLAKFFPLLKDKHSIRAIDEIPVWFRPPGKVAAGAPLQGAMKKIYGADYFSTLIETTNDQAFINWFPYLWSWMIRCVIWGSSKRLIRNYNCYKLLRKLGSQDFPRLATAAKLLTLHDLSEKTYQFGCEQLRQRGHIFNQPHFTTVPQSEDWDGSIIADSFHVPLSTECSEAITQAKLYFDAHAPGVVLSILVTPVTPIAIDEYNVGVFFVVTKDPSLQDARRLNEIFYSIQKYQFCTPYIVSSCVAYATSHIDFDPGSNVILSWATHPTVFLGLTQPSSVIFGSTLQIEQSMLINNFKIHRERYLAEAEEYIVSSISHPNIVRVPPLDFQLLFWQGLQMKLIRQRDTYVFSAKAICLTFQNEPGFEWLSEMHQEYVKVLAGNASDSEKFYQRAIKVLSEIYRDSEAKRPLQQARLTA